MNDLDAKVFVSLFRAAYEQDFAQLMTASHVIAVHFQTVAAGR